ncbi:MAG: hypothetical protein KAT62_07160 [Desulfuromonadales bacterium]|nr:hypothetical protein [Desulfuromonadales bacterium]
MSAFDYDLFDIGAGETIQGIAVALKAGAPKTIFDKTVAIHPTTAVEFITMRSKGGSIPN